MCCQKLISCCNATKFNYSPSKMKDRLQAIMALVWMKSYRYSENQSWNPGNNVENFSCLKIVILWHVFGEMMGDLRDHTQCFFIKRKYYSFVNNPKGNTGEAVVTCLSRCHFTCCGRFGSNTFDLCQVIIKLFSYPV